MGSDIVVVGKIGRSIERPIAIPEPYAHRDAAMLGNTLTLTLLTQIIEERDQGYMQRWVDLANEARRKDPHLHSQLALREQSVVETEFDTIPGKDADKRGSKKKARMAVAACRELEEEWDQRGNERWVAEFVAANYYPAGGHEVMWERVDGMTVPTHLEHLNERRLSYACDRSDPDPWALRLWDQDDYSQPRYGRKFSEFHPDKFLLNQPRVAGGVRTSEGLFATLVWFWFFKTWSWRDLMALLEMTGRPPIVAYYAAGGARAGRLGEMDGPRMASPPEIAAAKKAVDGLSGSMRSVLADTTRLEAFKVEAAEKPPHILAAEVLDAYTSKAINGVANLSDLKAGARAAVEAQERTSYTFWRADCRNVARLKTELYRRFIRANPDKFGEDCPIPIAKPQIDPPKDRVATLDAIERAQKVGIVVPEAWARREADIPAPQDGEPTLKAPEPKPAPTPAGETTDDKEPGEEIDARED